MPKYQAPNDRRMVGLPMRASLCSRAHEPGGFNQVAARVPAASQVIVRLDGDNRWNGRVQCG